MDDFGGLFTPTLSPGLFEDIQFGLRTAAEWASVPFAMDADVAIDDHPRVLKSRAKPEPAKTPVASTSALREFPEILHEAPVPTSPLVSRKKQRLKDARKRKLAVPALTKAKRFRGSHVTPTDLDVLRGRGGSTNNHPGNVRFREEVKKVKSLYQTSSIREKNKLTWVSTGDSLSWNKARGYLESQLLTISFSGAREHGEKLWWEIPGERRQRGVARNERKSRPKESVSG